MNEPTIIFVEDDDIQVDTFQQTLENYCLARRRPLPSLAVYHSEGSFLETLERSRVPASLYIFDLMLKWREVGEDLTVQKPADYHGDWAGVRCKDAVFRRFRDAKVIVWTAIADDHLPEQRVADCWFVKDKLEIHDVFNYLRT